MFGTYFYFANLRNLTAVFGDLFNDVNIQRRDIEDNLIKTFQVPLSYAPRNDYFVRLQEEADRAEGPAFQITLPRMSYEMVGMTYDTTRKLNTLRYQKKEDSDNLSHYYKQFTPVPWTINYDLHIYSQYIDDALQVLEQIVPYFSPTVSVTVKDVELMDKHKDIKINLDSVGTPIESEGPIGEGRTIIWTLSFSAAAWLYPPIKSVPIIKKVIENIQANSDEVPDQIITTEVDPLTANYLDPWTIKKTIIEP